MSMYTEPAHRGRGVAKMALRNMISWSRKKGCPAISPHASRLGRPIYTSFGWEPTT
jgi:GNAT superfamily N-acetyltransferase